MTALIIVSAGAIVCLGSLFILWCLLSVSARADEQAQQDAWDDLVSLQHLAAERARTEMRERLLHARVRSVREGRDE